MKKRCERERLVRRIRDRVPRVSGVYLFYDEEGRLLYVGKSKDLRARMLSYFHGRSAEARIRRMVHQIREFGFWQTGSELHALILEDRLIKNHLPCYNVRQKRFMNHQYLELTEEAFPVLRRVERPADGTAPLFGPFKDRFFVEGLLQMVRRYFLLRACTDPMPHRKCMRGQIRLCSTPCNGGVGAEEYERLVAEAKDFLNGAREVIEERLDEEFQRSVAALAFEKAQEVRKRMLFVEGFCRHRRFIHRFMKENLVIVENGGQDLTHLFIRGEYRLLPGVPAEDQIRALLPPEEDRAVRVSDRHLLDRAGIVCAWLHGNKDRCDYRFITVERDAPASTLIQTVRRCPGEGP